MKGTRRLNTNARNNNNETNPKNQKEQKKRTLHNHKNRNKPYTTKTRCSIQHNQNMKENISSSYRS